MAATRIQASRQRSTSSPSSPWRILAIYRRVYTEDHTREGIILANLAGVYLKREDYRGAEPIVREALAMYAKMKLKPDHNYVGIARIKLGRALRGQQRYTAAHVESLAGYEILKTQVSPTDKYLQNAREDLAIEDEALGRPTEARRYRDELAVNKHGT
jgi:tetratricopeptide (TPR) repeat protein